MKNTEKRFYALWTREEMIEELCRFNILLKNMDLTIEKVIKKIKK